MVNAFHIWLAYFKVASLVLTLFMVNAFHIWLAYFKVASLVLVPVARKSSICLGLYTKSAILHLVFPNNQLLLFEK